MAKRKATPTPRAPTAMRAMALLVPAQARLQAFVATVDETMDALSPKSAL